MSEASGIPAWCRVGAKVVCVDASPREGSHLGGLTAGRVYTIRDIAPNKFGAALLPCIRLKEIVRNIRPSDPFEVGYYIDRFRPAVPPKTQSEDVGLFRHHLDDVRADA